MSSSIAAWALKKALESTYDEAREAIPEALKAQGFGVLTHIDMKKTLHEKLGVEFRRYEIFGACNPPLAKAALTAALEVGVLLPCNVVLYEDDDKKAVVNAMDPMVMMADDAPEALRDVARGARVRLLAALESLR
jgi:uncharacterized protein (DUF302 family)